MTDKPELKTELDALAAIIASHAKKDQIPFADRLDAFKALTAYHLGLSKVKLKGGEEDQPKGETFDDFRELIKASGDRSPSKSRKTTDIA